MNKEIVKIVKTVKEAFKVAFTDIKKDLCEIKKEKTEKEIKEEEKKEKIEEEIRSFIFGIVSGILTYAWYILCFIGIIKFVKIIWLKV